MTELLLCLAAMAIDGDTIRCADGVRIRVQAIEANELHRPGCHLSVCAAMSGSDAKAWMQRQVGGKDLRYEPAGTSWKRVTAWVRLPDGRDLSCAAIRSGAAVPWDKFDKEGRLKRC